MKKRVERLRGMHDLLPEANAQQRWLVAQVSTFLANAGYQQVDAPILERNDLFQASFAQDAWQNLYSFRLHQRELCLRPEYTASICRLYLDHYQHFALPQRLQYAGPIFRYEAPGRGRYRQHQQIGIELFGGATSFADAEILQLACDTLHNLQIRSYRLELGHIGIVNSFLSRLQLDEHAVKLVLSLMEQISRSPEGEARAQERLEALYPESLPQTASQGENERELLYITSLLNSLSISFHDETALGEVAERLFWKIARGEQRHKILEALNFLRELHAAAGTPPQVFERLEDLKERYQLDPAPLAELRQLVEVVEQAGVPDDQIVVNLALGRGISYYTGLVFEIHASDREGYEMQLCGGGRYDRLVQAIGGSRDLQACGFAFGVERLVAVVPEETLPSLEPIRAVVIPVSADDIPYAMQIARKVREQGLSIEVDIQGNGVKAALRLAAKREMSLALIVGEDERSKGQITHRDLHKGIEKKISFEDWRDVKELGNE